MKIIAALSLGLAMLVPFQPIGAFSIEFLSAGYIPGRPTVTDSFLDSVEDKEAADRAIAHNFQLMQRVPHIKYQVTGSTDGQECSGSNCLELALRRARLFQAALVEAGAPTSMFCPPKAVVTPWPSSYTPQQGHLVIGRQANLEPVFNGCA